MKLYTEEQVYLMLYHAKDIYEDYMTYEDVLRTQKPIELPSDEDIEKIINPNKLDKIPESWKAEIAGAKWIKSQILKQIESC